MGPVRRTFPLRRWRYSRSPSRRPGRRLASARRNPPSRRRPTPAISPASSTGRPCARPTTTSFSWPPTKVSTRPSSAAQGASRRGAPRRRSRRHCRTAGTGGAFEASRRTGTRPGGSRVRSRRPGRRHRRSCRRPTTHRSAFPTQPLLLSWKPCSAPCSYAVAIARDPAMTSLVDGAQTVTTATSYIPPSTLADGTYYWTVTPVDAENHAGTTSAVRSFNWSWPTHTQTSLMNLIQTSRRCIDDLRPAPQLDSGSRRGQVPARHQLLAGLQRELERLLLVDDCRDRLLPAEAAAEQHVLLARAPDQRPRGQRGLDHRHLFHPVLRHDSAARSRARRRSRTCTCATSSATAGLSRPGGRPRHRSSSGTEWPARRLRPRRLQNAARHRSLRLSVGARP